MPTKDDKNLKKSESLRDKSSLLVHGMDNVLDDEDYKLNNIIQKTIIDTKTKLGKRTNNKPINYFNEINFGNAFNEIMVKKDTDSDVSKDNLDFKRMMTENPSINIGSMLLDESTRTLVYNNYRIINKHIPECANALNIYVDNILSPDDFTKLIFNIKYEGTDDKIMEAVSKNLKEISEKYQLEDKATEIIKEALMLGDSYCAVLSLEDELQTILNDPLYNDGILNEDTYEKFVKSISPEATDYQILENDISLTNEESDILKETFGVNDNIEKMLVETLNRNVQVGTKKELLREKFEAELDNRNRQVDIPDEYVKFGKKKRNKKGDNKPLFTNGSVIRRLVPERVVELNIDGTCYGYYYAEEAMDATKHLGMTSGRDVKGDINLAANGTIASTNTVELNPTSTASVQLGISDQKLRVISDIFLKNITKKIDKKFLRDNKEFKDFIYDLLRQDFIIKKGLRLTYFRPDEVIKFEVEPVYKDIIFIAKMYLSILTNNLLIKLGRAHDKRIFYVNVGADAKYEEAINSIINDVKTKDYKMENLNDFNTILNLAPGRFDDYFMPTINGDRPIDIDTLPGMDVDMNNDFVEYLKNSLMSGMGVPRNLIDVTSDVDFARTISAMNSNFVRSVIKYQKKLTPPFTRFLQILYRNEYRFVNDGENKENLVDLHNIKVSFPSPATLSMNNILDQLQAADQNAEYISSQLYPLTNDQRNEEKRIMLKTLIVKDLVPSVDWERYSELMKKVETEGAKSKIENPTQPEMDPYSQGY